MCGYQLTFRFYVNNRSIARWALVLRADDVIYARRIYPPSLSCRSRDGARARNRGGKSSAGVVGRLSAEW